METVAPGLAAVQDTDAGLVSECKKGSSSAFEALVRRHQKRVFNTVLRMIGNHEDASEVTQDAFVSAYRSIGGFEGRSRFSTWLHSIAINLAKNRIKQVGSRKFHEPVSTDDPVPGTDGDTRMDHASDDPPAEERIERMETKDKLLKCLDSLDPESREAIVLLDVQGFSYEEIGQVLKIPGGTVRSRIFRAREELIRMMKQGMEE